MTVIAHQTPRVDLAVVEIFWPGPFRRKAEVNDEVPKDGGRLAAS